MKIEFNLTKDDYIAFNMHHIETSPTIRRSLLIQQYGVSVIFLIVPYFFSRISRAPMLASFIVYGAIFLAWILYYPKYFMHATKKRIIKLIDEGDNSAILGIHSITLTDEGIVQESRTGESKSTWGSVKRIDETSEHIYIFIGTVNAYLVPKRDFEGKIHMEAFIDMLREKTGLKQ